MEAIGKKIRHYQHRLKQAQAASRRLRQIGRHLAERYKLTNISALYEQGGKLVVRADSKAQASEIFLNKQAILTSLRASFREINDLLVR